MKNMKIAYVIILLVLVIALDWSCYFVCQGYAINLALKTTIWMVCSILTVFIAILLFIRFKIL